MCSLTENVIDWSMTVLEESSKTVIDRSMTILRQSLWELVKAENHWLIILIMDIPLMAKCHLPQSMTKIYGQNFKKNVIDDGQWQKNCHLLKGIYPKSDVLWMNRAILGYYFCQYFDWPLRKNKSDTKNTNIKLQNVFSERLTTWLTH